jgi:Fe2+ or Zn2+ uptake regulation protein
MRATPQKQAILNVLQQCGKLMTAEDVYSQVRLIQPNVSLGTVYRNLQNFSVEGKIRRILLADGKARFEVAGHTHHHYLICLGCGETTEVPWCPLGQEVAAFMTGRDFVPVNHQFEVYGYCHRCRVVQDASQGDNYNE